MTAGLSFLLWVSLATVGDNREAQFAEAIERLDAWDTERAAQLAERLAAEGPREPQAQVLLARVRYLEGRYREAEAILDALASRPLEPEVAEVVEHFRDQVKPVVETARRFKSRASEHFQIEYVPGPDEVMIDEGLRVLEQAYPNINADFGLEPEGPIRVEIYPDATSFQRASTLTREQIETSGTIALCKFKRIMLLSPRWVLRGYPWTDTLVHEYAHYVLWLRNGPSVPIWLHEGLARYEEERWDGGPGSELTPFMKDALADALRDNKLVTFDEMHPSFALLDDPQKVAIAGAEVLAVVHTIVERGGSPLVERMLDALREGASWRQMFELALDEPFDRFFDEFKADWGKKLEGHGGAAIGEHTVELAEAGTAEPGPSAAAQDGPGTRFARLGELLAERGFDAAAAVEYERAAELQEPTSELLAAWGASLHRAGRLDEAARVLGRAVEAWPDHAHSLVNLGRVLRDSGREREALAVLTEAFRINPFDPSIHEMLVQIHGVLGDEARRREAELNYRIVSARPAGADEQPVPGAPGAGPPVPGASPRVNEETP